jgi:simple sugar transport system substrate-binding protein
MTQTFIALLTRILKRATIGVLALALSAAFTGCKKSETASDAVKSGGAASGGDKPLTVGFIYVGTKDDYGYNEAHADGAAAVAKIPGVTVIENENVLETNKADQALESMINLKGATLLFPTSYGYFEKTVPNIAKKYPNITLLHAGGMWKDGIPSNVGAYFAYMDEMEYLCGMAAGAATKTGKIGYIAAHLIPPVVRDINAFELGAKSMNPNVTLTVIVTDGWFEPVKEASAVDNLANSQIDVVSGHIDSPKVMIQKAEERGIYCCGYHYNGSKLAPKGYLTGAEWNWGPMYAKYVTDFKAGTLKLPHGDLSSFADGVVKISPYGPGVSAETQKKIEAVKADMGAKKFKMFKGPLKDNDGNEIVAAGKELDDQDGSLWGMPLVEGVIGKLPKK